MKIGVLGFGHLGKALVSGLLAGGETEKKDIFVSAKSSATLQTAQTIFGVNPVASAGILTETADILFLVLRGEDFFRMDFVPPQDGWGDKTVVSLMAGVTIEQISRKIGADHIVRAMPSISIDRADGVIGFTHTENARLRRLFDRMGFAFEIGEADIEKVTVFSACGLGFAAYLLAAFEEAGEKLGFDKELSGKITAKIFSSAARLTDFQKMAEAVATKGGATERGIACFNENRLPETVYEGILKAYQQTKTESQQ